jgi:hypothetical protein
VELLTIQTKTRCSGAIKRTIDTLLDYESTGTISPAKLSALARINAPIFPPDNGAMKHLQKRSQAVQEPPRSAILGGFLAL